MFCLGRKSCWVLRVFVGLVFGFLVVVGVFCEFF